MNVSQLEIEKGAACIYEKIKKAMDERTGLLIGRHGTVEFQSIQHKETYGSLPLTPGLCSTLHRNAGVFPCNSTSLGEWLGAYWDSSCYADGLATGWHAPIAKDEINFVTRYNPSASQFPLRSLEPYYVGQDLRWTQLLANKRVTVVSSFTKTMSKQIKHIGSIWPNESMLPLDIEWNFVRTYYPSDLTKMPTAWSSNIGSWSEAVKDIVHRVLLTKPDVVFIGCGGLGMIVGAELKRKGVIAIVLGGAIQVLFGIKGGRWKTHPTISAFWNSSWVYPGDDETPLHAGTVEKYCYWAP